MPKSQPIFHRQWLSPRQMRTVAQRRFADALCLRQSNQNERANGVMYLAGFVIECLLKARLLEQYPWLQSTRSSEKLGAQERDLWSLCYRSHDLEEILPRLPALPKLLMRPDGDLLPLLREICGSWTIFARYSTRSATMNEAALFLANIKELKRCLE